MNDNKVLIIDVREEEEFRRFHLDNSVSIPLWKLNRISLSGVLFKQNTEVLFICEDGKRSALAVVIAKKLFPDKVFYAQNEGLKAAAAYSKIIKHNHTMV